jgi:isopenicillin N synthase-like dioxygenase
MSHTSKWPDPTSLPDFRPTIENYLDAIEELSSSFRSLVAEALDLPSNAFDDFFDVPQQNKFKLIKYPEPFGSRPGEETQGVGPHKDSCFLTFLLQATPHTGLEVQNKAGTWLPVHPIPGTLVINIGRALEAITGGVCTATTHRVNLRRENYLDANGQSIGPRFSFAVFSGVSLDLGVEKIHIEIPQHIKELVKDDKVRSDAEATFNEMFTGSIGQGTLIARITSHQDVAQRWYPDLLKQALRAQHEKL